MPLLILALPCVLKDSCYYFTR